MSIIGAAFVGATSSAAAPDAEPHSSAAPIASTPAPSTLRELFPGVHASLQDNVVEIEATVSPMLVPDARAPRFYLEVLACAPGTREHETFFVIRAKPSHIHAAMLAAGFSAGAPGRIERVNGKLSAIDATGERLILRAVYRGKETSNTEIVADPLEWVIDADRVPVVNDALNPAGPSQPGPNTEVERAASFLEHERDVPKTAPSGRAPGWVFAGSRLIQRPVRVEHTTPLDNPQAPAEMYQADGTGVIIGFTTFGSEVIAWSRAISPDAAIQAPEWVADFSKTPPAGASVRIRITKHPVPRTGSAPETPATLGAPANSEPKK